MHGADTTCWALAQHVTTVSLRRVNPTASRITAEQLRSIPKRVTVAIGVPDPFAQAAAPPTIDAP